MLIPFLIHFFLSQTWSSSVFSLECVLVTECTNMRAIGRTLPLVCSVTNGYFYVCADNNDGGYGGNIHNWHKWTYPLRPDSSEIGKFLNFLEMLPTHKTALILGSTPELRDAAFINDKMVTCVDINSNTLRFLRNNMKYKNYVKNTEELIECDWLKMNQHNILSQKEFDLILSEESINMLPLEKWDKFLNEIYDRLSNDGYFILKVMCKPPDGYFDEVSIDKIINDWCISEKYNDDCGYLFVHLLAYLYQYNDIQNGKENNINWKYVIQIVQNEINKNTLKWTDKQKNNFFEIFGNLQDKECTDFIFFCKTEEEMRKLLISKQFYFEDVCYGNDDFDKYKFTPIYVLGKESYRVGGKPRKLSTGSDEAKTASRMENLW